MNKKVIILICLVIGWPTLATAWWPRTKKVTNASAQPQQPKHSAKKTQQTPKKVNFSSLREVRYYEPEEEDIQDNYIDDEALLKPYPLMVFFINTELIGTVVIDVATATTINRTLQRIKNKIPESLSLFYKSILTGNALPLSVMQLLYEEKLITNDGSPLNAEILALVRHHVKPPTASLIQMRKLWLHELQEHQEQQLQYFAVYRATRHAMQQPQQRVFFDCV